MEIVVAAVIVTGLAVAIAWITRSARSPDVGRLTGPAPREPARGAPRADLAKGEIDDIEYERARSILQRR